jgi:hypothetical protein
VKVFVEAGAKRVFAVALDWPGWARSGKTEEVALDALVRYGSRYKTSMGSAAGNLQLPSHSAELEVAVRLRGGAGTDFGAPSAVAAFDRQAVTDAELNRLGELLRAAWNAFDAAADRAEGRPLATGPRGGGRSLDKIREHVLEADSAYIGALGARRPGGRASRSDVQDAFLAALEAKIRGELPERGPRGGERWPARYAVRRSAWHALDHAWEIEDRSG